MDEQRSPHESPWGIDADADRLERAQQAVRLLIAAYSARIAAADPTEAAELRGHRSRYAEQLRTLGEADPATLDQVTADYPALARQVRNA
jgi:hypothetical protein